MRFYDLKSKKMFETSKYKIITKVTKSGVKMKFAVAKAPSGISSYKIIGKA